MAAKDFVGIGWQFPFRFDAQTGGVAKDRGRGTAQKFKRITMSLSQIIGVKKGEMFGRRGFGSTVRDMVFTLDTLNFRQRLSFSVTRAIEHRIWGEPRIVVDSADADLDRSTGQAIIDVVATIRSSNERQNLVFPFYVDAAERSLADLGLTGGV